MRKLRGSIDELELERDIEKRKREVVKLEAKKKINMIKEKVKKFKDLCEEYQERTSRVRSKIRRVEKKKVVSFLFAISKSNELIFVKSASFIRIICSSDGQSIFDILNVVFCIVY